MDDLLGQNLAALQRINGVDPFSAGTVSNRTLLVDAGSGPRLRTAGGRDVRLGSARNARSEAEGLIAAALGDGSRAEAVAVIGGGTGAVLEALETMPVRRIVVIEPDAELASHWLASRSWIPLIDANRLRVIVGPHYVGTAEAARFLEGVDRLPVVAHPVLAREYPEEMAAARRALDRVVRDALANANARQRFEDLALVNTLRNLPALAAGGDVAALFGRFPLAPAVVVGAGPSLDDNLAAILEVQDRALVIATDTALLPCLKAGIVPPLVVALDPSESNGTHLVACAGATDTHLVTEASVDPAGVEAFAGRTFVFRVGDHAPWPWLAASGVTRGRLSVWGSVATAALDLALKAGCPAVAFAGLDLAYTAGRPYCRGTVFEETWAWEVAGGRPLAEQWRLALSSRSTIAEPDVHGNPTPSASHLLAFRDWIRETVATHPRVHVANVTGAGVLHGPGIAQRSLAEFVGNHAVVGRTAFASSVRSAWRSSPDAARRLATQLGQERSLEVVHGHSAPERAATEHASPERLREARRQLEAHSQEGARGRAPVTFASGPRVHLPEQTALLHALKSTDRRSAAGSDRQRAITLLDDAYDRLAGLIGDARGIRCRFPPPDLVTYWHRVPARLLFAWPSGLAEAVDTFGSRLADAIRLAGRGSSLPEIDAPPAGDDPLCESAIDRGRPPGPDAEAQLAPATLIWQWTLACALTIADEADLARAALKLLQAPPALAPAGRPATRLTAWLARRDAAGAAMRLPFLPGLTTARAITGLVATSAPADGSASAPNPDPVGLRLCPTETGEEPLRRVCAIEPESLVRRGHPRAHNLSRLSDCEVLVGRSDGTGIDVMSEFGALVRVEAWPLPARASIPLGAHGRLAWHFPDAPRLLHRDLATGQVDVIELPVTVFDAVERPDGTVYLATDDGLWTWRRGHPALPVVRGPGLVSISTDGDGIQARQRPRRDPDGRWEATTAILEWRRGEQAFRTIPVAPGTAPFAVADQRGWRAEAWLDGCVIRLVRPDSRVFWLACTGPRSLAWAGATLYVATAAGEVLRFPDVMTLLAAE